jgi:predicted ester cyclase
MTGLDADQGHDQCPLRARSAARHARVEETGTLSLGGNLMSKEQNLKALALGGEIVAAHDFDRFGEFFAEHIVDHDPADGQAAGLEGVKQYWRGLFESFPDFALAPDVVLADDDYLTLALRVSGTHNGEYMGHAPTGRRFDVRALQVARFEDGLMVERWGCTDILGILSQLGLSV